MGLSSSSCMRSDAVTSNIFSSASKKKKHSIEVFKKLAVPSDEKSKVHHKKEKEKGQGKLTNIVIEDNEYSKTVSLNLIDCSF